MTEWTVVTVIIALVGLIGTVAAWKGTTETAAHTITSSRQKLWPTGAEFHK